MRNRRATNGVEYCPGGGGMREKLVAVGVSDFPVSVDGLSPEFLTAVLQVEGSLRHGRVTRVTARPISEPGQTSTVAHLSLDYSEPSPDTPRTLVAKMAPPPGALRQSGMALRLYEREARFYQELGLDPGIPVPRCYYADADPQTGDFLLLLEDLSTCRSGDPWISALADVTTAIDALAPFHAKWWQAPRLRELTWMRQPDDTSFIAIMRGIFLKSLPVVQHRWPQHMNGYLGHVAARLAERWEAYLQMAPGDPWTLIHTDYHPKQMFFPTGQGGRFVVFDWQSPAVGRAEADLSRILLTGLREVDLARHQTALLERYHVTLEGCGVRYAYEELDLRTRRAMLTTLFINIYALATTDVSILETAAAQRGVSFAARFFDDFSASLERNRVAELI